MWSTNCGRFPGRGSTSRSPPTRFAPAAPNKLGEDLCDTQEKVKRYDRKTVEYFGLEEKDYVYQDLIRAMDAKATPEMLADICRDCCWFPVSACCKNICSGKYVK